MSFEPALVRKTGSENEPMKTSRKPFVALPSRRESNDRMAKRMIVWGVALVSFAAGCLVSAGLIHAAQAGAGGARVFELCIYHAEPGKAAALESVWRDASKYLTKHGINVLGYWRPNEDPAWADTFVYVVSFPDRAEAEKQWDSLHHDPEFRPYIEAAKPLIRKADGHYKVDEVYMRPTEFSPLR